MEPQQEVWQKYMDRAFYSLDEKGVNMLEKMSPKIAVLMLLELGKTLCEEDEWKRLTRQLKPRWWEFVKNLKLKLSTAGAAKQTRR